jgi:hypothetical protein
MFLLHASVVEADLSIIVAGTGTIRVQLSRRTPSTVAAAFKLMQTHLDWSEKCVG